MDVTKEWTAQLEQYRETRYAETQDKVPLVESFELLLRYFKDCASHMCASFEENCREATRLIQDASQTSQVQNVAAWLKAFAENNIEDATHVIEDIRQRMIEALDQTEKEAVLDNYSHKIHRTRIDRDFAHNVIDNLMSGATSLEPSPTPVRPLIPLVHMTKRKARMVLDNSRSTAGSGTSPSTTLPVSNYASLLGTGPPEAVSSVASYQSNFAALGAIALFGASVTYSAFFNLDPTAVDTQIAVILAWSAALFSCGVVSAFSMSILSAADIKVNMSRSMTLRRILRSFAIAGSLFNYAALILLSVGILVADSNTVNAAHRRSRKASAYLVVAITPLQIMLAVYARLVFSDTPWTF